MYAFIITNYPFIIRNAYPYHSIFILDIFILLYKNRN